MSTGGSSEYHVSPDGDDRAAGTATEPFATVERARRAVREELHHGLDRDMRVVLRAGTYRLKECFRFGLEDSGTERNRITWSAWPNERVVLSGGRSLAGWREGERGVWTTHLPDVEAGRWYFRQLFVNGRRAVRARTPNVGDPIPWLRIGASSVTDAARPPADADIRVRLSAGTVPIGDPGEAELVYIANNAGSRKRIRPSRGEPGMYVLPPPHRWAPEAFGTEWKLSIPTEGRACFLENSLEFLDEPGEWFLDRRTGVLSYYPLPGEDMSRAEVVAPLVGGTLVSVAGTPERPVVNLHLAGIRVEHVEWPLPAEGYLGMFCCNIPTGDERTPGHRFTDAAVEFSFARGCSFSGGAVTHVGAMGVCLREGSSYIALEGNEISDIGGGGIGAGYPNAAYGYLHAAPPPGRDEYRSYSIRDNRVHHCGMVDFGAAGIALFAIQDSVVAHNLVHDTAYFGIGFAGSQDPKHLFARNNRVEFNHVHHVMQTTVDGAGIYTTFAQSAPGSVVRGNLVHDLAANPFNNRPIGPYSASGFYLDGGEGTPGGAGNFGCRYVFNVSFASTASLFFFAKNTNEWRDNLFMSAAPPPPEFVEALQGWVGPRPGSTELIETEEGYQLNDRRRGSGAMAVFRCVGAAGARLAGLDPRARYEVRACSAALRWRPIHEQLPDCRNWFVDPPEEVPVRGTRTRPVRATGATLMNEGVAVDAGPDRVTWVLYRRADR